ncbi:MAG: zinc metalloprotease HtpX [Burkholderiales bacterium]|nr:zinc metalloprotease HtpX [Burkholderiales bacterium]
MSPAKVHGRRLSNFLQTAALLGAMALLAGYLGWALLGTDGLVAGAVAVVLLLAFGPQVSPRMVLRMMGAAELHPSQAPGLYRLLHALSERAGLERAPRLYYLPTRVLNAFAMGRRDDAAITVTDALLRRLAPREIAGVLAHELAHVRSNDVWVMTLAELVGRLTGTLSFFGLALLFVWLPISILTGGSLPLVPILVMVLAPTLSAMLQLALSRTREFDADIAAVELTGDPRGLASALDTLEKLQGGWMERMFMARVPKWLRSHPETEERIRRLLDLEGERPLELAGWAADPFLGRPTIERAPRWHWSGLWY